MPFYFVQCREFLKSQFNQAWVLPLLWGTISFKAINFSWGCVHFTVFPPPWINNNNKNRIVSQSHLHFIKAFNFWSFKYSPFSPGLSHLFWHRHLERMSSRRMLGLWYHSPGPQEPHKTKSAVPSNWGPALTLIVAAQPQRQGLKSGVLYLIGMPAVSQLFPSELPLARRGTGLYKATKL